MNDRPITAEEEQEACHCGILHPFQPQDTDAVAPVTRNRSVPRNDEPLPFD